MLKNHRLISFIRFSGATALCAMAAACATVDIQPAAQADRSMDHFTKTGIYLSARLADSEQDADTATVLLSKVLGDDPDNDAVLQRLLFQAQTAGRFDVAVHAARDLVTRRPGHGMAHLVLATDAAASGNWPLVDSELNLIVDGPTSFVAPLLRAWSAQAQGRTDNALELLDVVEQQKRLTQLATVHRALILDVAGRHYDAKTVFVRVLKDGNAPLRFVELYGNFLSRTEQADSAKDLYLRTLEIVPDYDPIATALANIKGPPPAPQINSGARGMAEALFNIGSALSQEQSRDLSLIYLRLAYVIAPSSDLIKLTLGDVLMRVGRENEGQALMDSVEPSSLYYLQAQLNVASALAIGEKFEEAERRLVKLAKAVPGSAQPYIALGDQLRARELYGRAVEAYDAAFTRIPEPTKRHWRIYFARGSSLERLDRWPEAQSDLELALALSPDEPTVLNYLGYSWLDRGLELDKAKTLIERAAQLQPNDGFIIDSLGWAYFQSGDLKRAVAALERAVQLKPQDATINEHLGDAYWRAGRKLEARFQWTHSLNLKPDHDQEAELQRKMTQGLDKTPKPSQSQIPGAKH
jgi:tetratricopeptide (TPR) repeat protein